MKALHAVAVCLIATSIKLLLIPSYRSTDFEVHRNWLAITSSTPLCNWYFEKTSEWTLDYPPLFAYFEYMLSFPAQLADKNMLKVRNLNYASQETVTFQRLSVIVSDVALFVGAYLLARASGWSMRNQTWVFILLVLNVGLLMVDHIHFQYNGMLVGLLLASVAAIMAKRHVAAVVLMTALFMAKHLFLTLVPVYFFYLLKVHCIEPAKRKSSRSDRVKVFATGLATLGAAALAVIALALAPFLMCPSPGQQLAQMFARLFPFGRGLVHAYWAPNVWALYMFADRILLFAAKLVFPSLKNYATAVSSTAGMVGDFGTVMLPSPRPLFTMFLVILTMIPAIVSVWQDPRPRTFLKSLFFASLSSFMLGWHIHEKAILIPVMLLALLIPVDPSVHRLYFRVSTAGVFCLLPLFFTTPENYVKVCLWAAHVVGTHWILRRIDESWKLIWLDKLLVVGLATLALFAELIHPVLFRTKSGQLVLPFLPNMLISCFCGAVLIYCWLESYYPVCRTSALEITIRKKHQ